MYTQHRRQTADRCLLKKSRDYFAKATDKSQLFVSKKNLIMIFQATQKKICVGVIST